eukprot:scaffold16987_cov227-Skeletonema_marinoi.AAC.1
MERIEMQYGSSVQSSINNATDNCKDGDASIGDPERAYLGSNGLFEFYKCTITFKTIVRYVNEEVRPRLMWYRRPKIS